MPATTQGVGNSRNEQMAAILENRKVEIDRELKEGGTAEGIAILEQGAVTDADPLRPSDIPQEDWAAMSDEQKNLAIADAKKKVEDAAAAAAVETDEERGAREAREKEETERKAAEAAAAAAPKKIKLKVDGKEVEVDEAKVLEAGVRTLQKETAADKRLEEASKVGAEANRLLTEAQNMIKSAAQGRTTTDTEASPSKPDGKASKVLTDEELTTAVKAIQYGSEAEAKEALQNLVTKAANSGQSEELTLVQVNEMLDFRDARQWAETEYKDVLGDPNLRKLFLTKEREKRAAGDNRPYRELYGEIGNEVRDWRKSLAPAPANPQPAGGSRADVRERKATLVPVPTASSRLPAATTTKELTPTETIGAMRDERERKAGRLK